MTPIDDLLARRRLGVETALWTAWCAAAAAYLPAVLSAAYLSDGAAILWSVHQWNASHELWTRIGELFLGRLPTGNDYYRPLPFVTFALDFDVFGARAAGWRITNLLWHLAAIAGVYGLALRLIGAPRCGSPMERSVGRESALLAALLFGLCPAGPEVVTWVAGRYDVIATAAIFASLYALARSRTGTDRAALASWLAAIVALLSKESAAVIGPVSGLIALDAAWAAHRSEGHALAAGFLRRWLPFVAIFAAYMAWREHVFGSVFRVYTADHPAWNVDLAASLRSIGDWYAGLVPEIALRRVLAVLSGTVLVTAAWRACRHAASARALVLALASVVIAIGLVLPHKPAFAATGEDARFFYTASGFLAIALAVAAAPVASKRAIGSGLVLALATAAVSIVALEHNVREWANASRGMQALLRDLDACAAGLGADDYALVLVPDHLGPVPFGRNAQGSLVLPPLQQSAISGRLVPLIPGDLSAWFTKLARGVVPTLRTLPLDEVDRSLASRSLSPIPEAFVPSRYFCWNGSSRRLVPVRGVEVSGADRWLASWRTGLVAAGCATLARAVQ